MCLLDEIHDEVLDEWHVRRPASRSEPHQIVVKDHVEHPVEAVLDAPVGWPRSAELGG